MSRCVRNYSAKNMAGTHRSVEVRLLQGPVLREKTAPLWAGLFFLFVLESVLSAQFLAASAFYALSFVFS